MAEVLLVAPSRSGVDASVVEACRRALDQDLVVASRHPVVGSGLSGVRTVAPTMNAMAKAMSNSAALVIAGGTVFRPGTTSEKARLGLLPTVVAWQHLARSRGVPVALVGVSASEIRGTLAARMIRSIVRRADLLVLRDEESGAQLTAAGAPGPFWVGADLRWRSASVDASRTAGTAITVALDGAPPLGVLDSLAETLPALSGRRRLRVQPWSEPLHPAADALGRSIGAELLAPPESLSAAAASYRGSDLVIATRTSAQIAAALAGTRSLAVGGEPSSVGLAKRLGQASVPASSSDATVRSALLTALTRPPASAAAIDEQVDLADRTFDLVRLLIDRGAVQHPETVRPLAMTSGRGLA